MNRTCSHTSSRSLHPCPQSYRRILHIASPEEKFYNRLPEAAGAGKPEEAVSREQEDNRGRSAWLSVGTVSEKMYSREVEIARVPRDHPLRASPDAHSDIAA